MGFGGISIWQLLIILVIIVLLFGTKRLRNIGNDLGSAIKGFRSSIKDSDSDDATFTAEVKPEPTAVQHQPAPAQPAAPQPTQTTSATQPSAAPVQPGQGSDKV